MNDGFALCFLLGRTSRASWGKEASMATVALMALLQRRTQTASLSRGGVKPCRPPSHSTQPQRAASVMGVTAGAAARVEEKEEALRDAEEEECMRISGRS